MDVDIVATSPPLETPFVGAAHPPGRPYKCNLLGRLITPPAPTNGGILGAAGGMSGPYKLHL